MNVISKTLFQNNLESLINETENRAVLHTAVRANEGSNIEVDNTNVIPGLNQTKTRIKDFKKIFFQVN